MIIYDTEYPEIMTPLMLDIYLASGWYRIGQTMMTTDISFTDNSAFRVFWLRFVVNDYRHGTAAKKIAAANDGFTVLNKPFGITPEIEKLFSDYKSAIDFEMTKSVYEYLLGEAGANIYNTRVLEIRDGARLIATGYFDEGEEAMAGILNFYHPAYKKYSLGKYLILEKMNLCVSKGKKYFYPGYISNDYPKFNYKLFNGKDAAEIYLRPQQKWHSYLSVDLDELAKEGW